MSRPPVSHDEVGVTPSSSPQGNAESSPVSLKYLMGLLARRRNIIVGCLLLSIGLSVAYVVTATRLYDGTVTVDVNPQNSESSSGLSELLQQTMQPDQQNTKLQTEIHIMQSASVLLETAQALDLAHKRPYEKLLAKTPVTTKDYSTLTPAQRATILGEMKTSLKFSVEPGTTIVDATYRSPDPTLARDLPNVLIDTYIGQDLGAGIHGTKRVSDWLQTQTQLLRSQVELSAQKLADFQREHNIIGVDESQNVLVDKLKLLNEQYANVEADRIAKETNYRIAETGNPELLGTLGMDPQLQALRTQQVALRSQYDELSTRYGAGYPRIQELVKQNAALQTQINAEIQQLQTHFRQDYQAAKTTEDKLSAALKDQEKAIFNLDERAAEYAMLRHDAEATRTLYDGIQLKLKESGIIDTLKSTRFRIVDDAVLPLLPVEPRSHMILLSGIMIGLAVGCTLALIVDSIDDAIFSTEELELTTGLPILGALPHVSHARKSDTKITTEEAEKQVAAERSFPELVTLFDPKGSASESFRALRSAMLLGFVDRQPRLQVITSTGQGDGKSFVAANYARILAQRGSTVLLIDADLRRGSMHLKFNLPSVPGLTNVLSDRNLPFEPFYPDPEVPTLAVLPRGPVPPNPTDLLASTRFMEVIEHWKTMYDYVIVDSAPIMPVSDTLPIAQKADLVLLIVRIGQTSKSHFLRIREQLRRLNVRVGGIVINDVTKSLNEYGYYYGGYKYDLDDSQPKK